MGASCWHYEVPYSDDPESALQTLRDEVFASGRYGNLLSNVNIWTSLRGMPLSLKVIVVLVKSFYVTSEFVSWVSRGFRGPGTIEEAVELAAKSGTHSILDIERCSKFAEFGAATPLSPRERLRIYGREEPTVEDLDRVGWDAAAEDLERWHAVYFPLFVDGTPKSLVFVGCSGD